MIGHWCGGKLFERKNLGLASRVLTSLRMRRALIHGLVPLLTLAGVAMQPIELVPPSGVQSPSALISLLNARKRRTVFICGPSEVGDEGERAIAVALVKPGASSPWLIERALDAMELDPDSEFATSAGWLAVVYAKTRGPSAFPRLRRMMDDKRFDGLLFALDSAAALSLRLTSYVNGSRDAQMRDDHGCYGKGAIYTLHTPCPAGWPEARIDTPSCGMIRDPRENMDKLISNWAWNDRTRFEQALGPRAKAIRGLSLGVPGVLPKDIAIGYRFEDAGPWSKPCETLDEKSDRKDAVQNPASADIETVFVNRNGIDCGSQVVRFVRVSIPDPGMYFTSAYDPETHKTKVTRGPTPEWALRKEYVVDNADVADLLQTFRACVEHRPAP